MCNPGLHRNQLQCEGSSDIMEMSFLAWRANSVPPSSAAPEVHVIVRARQSEMLDEWREWINRVQGTCARVFMNLMRVTSS